MNNSTSTGRLLEALRQEASQRRPGDRLPSTRQLVETHRVSPVTVSAALAALAAEGIVETRPGAGSFVAMASRVRPSQDYSWQTGTLGDGQVDASAMSPLFDPIEADGVISLATGYLHPSLMPLKALSASLTRAARLPDVWERPPLSGIRPLRAWFAQAAGPDIDPADVLIAPGGQGSITAALRALVPAGEPLLVESPTYPGAVSVARVAGIRTIPVPIDGGGVVPELLAEAFARTGARAFYCQPRYQNPTGTELSAARRDEVLAVARQARAFIVEDDYARWLSHGEHASRSLLSDDGDGRVVYIASLTKVASPSLRIGALIARGPVAARLQGIRIVDDLFVARPIQEATLDLVSRPDWPRHLHRLSTALARRSRILAQAVATYLPTLRMESRPLGGMHLWARLPPGLDDLAVAEHARRAGVVVAAGRSFFPAEPPSAYLRLTFSACRDVDLEEGIQRLAGAMAGLGSDEGRSRAARERAVAS